MNKRKNSQKALVANEHKVQVEVQDWFDEAFAPVKVTAPKITRNRVSDDDSKLEFVTSVDGTSYIMDPVSKTCRRADRVLKNFADLADIEIETVEMSMTTYQRYLKDRFNGEDAPIKKGKLHFRGYRISCTSDNGFLVEDTFNKYEPVDTEMEGIPTPKELGDWFERKAGKREHTPEELSEAYERGKKLQQREEPKEREEIDYEALRRKVLTQIDRIVEKVDPKFDPTKFIGMIPFRKWNRRAKALLNQWANKEIRYAKFLRSLREMTEEMEFTIETRKRVKFKGAVLPAFKTIGYLRNNMIEVDGKLTEAVPFIMDYLLHYEPKAMPQLMRYAKGMCSQKELLEDPFYVDHYIDYSRKALENTAENARLLSAFAEAIGIITPQDLLFDDSLKKGDKIMYYDPYYGEWKTSKIKDTTDGVVISGGIGITKFHKWIKL